ncbi:hypothetical protein HMN09_01057900 [Mycena chlorophos]|uniref:Uncharacterized protein n=1 Tax=Mycena chlorophos TaxID=658473 RepID=A0A8H6SBI9_MYCCL|nr:hypothetical protein HMN09_01057900 [Mycena chlorophos]
MHTSTLQSVPTSRSLLPLLHQNIIHGIPLNYQDAYIQLVGARVHVPRCKKAHISSSAPVFVPLGQLSLNLVNISPRYCSRLSFSSTCGVHRCSADDATSFNGRSIPVDTRSQRGAIPTSTRGEVLELGSDLYLACIW